MAPPRQDKGKKKLDAETSQHAEEQQAGNVKSRRLSYVVRTQTRMSVKYVKFQAFPSHNFNFETLLRNSGVDKLVSNIGDYYPDMIREFYTSIKFGTDEFGDLVFIAKVKNVEIYMDLTQLGQCLETPSEGEAFCHGTEPDNDAWSNYNSLEYFVSISRGTQANLMSRQRTKSSRVVKYANMLSVSDRMLHYVLAYVLVPKYSNHFQVSELELQLIRALKLNLKINWAYVIYQHMMHQLSLSGGLPYGRIVSRILEFSGVPLQREPNTPMTVKNYEINEVTATKNTGIGIGPNGVFRYKDPVAPSAPPTIPEDEITNAMLYNKMCSIETTMHHNHRVTQHGIKSLRKLFLSLNRQPTPSEEGDEESVEEDEADDMSESD